MSDSTTMFFKLEERLGSDSYVIHPGVFDTKEAAERELAKLSLGHTCVVVSYRRRRGTNAPELVE